MTDTLPDPPEIDPAVLAGTHFEKVRKGLDPVSVHATLGRAADALRIWELRDRQLREKVAKLEQQVVDSQDLDESRMVSVLGEETAKIVTAAKEAATAIRTKAEEQAERLLRETEESSTAAAEELIAESKQQRDEASRLREEATAEAERISAESTAAADALSAAALQRHDELIEQAEAVLELRTHEAELAAEALRLESAAKVATANSEASEIRASAEEAAAASKEQAREEGRAMVAEAKAIKERMFEDLAARRTTARRQIEASRGGRDRIVELLRAAVADVASTIEGLEDSEADVQAAAVAAANQIEDDIDDVLSELKSDASSEATPLDSEPALSLVATLEAVEQPEVVELVEESEVVETLEVIETLELVEDSEDVEILEVVETREVIETIQDSQQETAPSEEENTDSGATVHDLFARIRSQGLIEDQLGVERDASMDERDKLLLPVEKQLSKALRRLASDEQNEVLDYLRRIKTSRPDFAKVLESSDRVLTKFADSLLDDFTQAVAAGSEFWAAVSGVTAGSLFSEDDQIEECLRSNLEQFLEIHRAHLERSFRDGDEAGLENNERAERIRATYRDW
ncbi:MAG: hypothetical protein F2518_03215, partial [Actinobacteria bacterium]|nr:hypothetical protein [Actinomycetota bacterium]